MHAGVRARMTWLGTRPPGTSTSSDDLEHDDPALASSTTSSTMTLLHSRLGGARVRARGCAGQDDLAWHSSAGNEHGAAATSSTTTILHFLPGCTRVHAGKGPRSIEHCEANCGKFDHDKRDECIISKPFTSGTNRPHEWRGVERSQPRWGQFQLTLSRGFTNGKSRVS